MIGQYLKDFVRNLRKPQIRPTTDPSIEHVLSKLFRYIHYHGGHAERMTTSADDELGN